MDNCDELAAQNERQAETIRSLYLIKDAAHKVIQVREYRRYLSPGDEAQDNLAGQFEDHLDDLATALKAGNNE